MKLQNMGITGFTLHDRETGSEMDAEWLAEDEQYKRLMIDDIEGFAFGAEGQLYLLDECGVWEDVDADKYDVHWEFAKRILVLTFDENAKQAVLAMPKMDQELAGRILAFFIRYYAKNMIDNGASLIDVIRMISTAANYGLNETYKDLLDEEQNNEKRNKNTSNSQSTNNE